MRSPTELQGPMDETTVISESSASLCVRQEQNECPLIFVMAGLKHTGGRMGGEVRTTSSNHTTFLARAKIYALERGSSRGPAANALGRPAERVRGGGR
jgi:hypothetical protein